MNSHSHDSLTSSAAMSGRLPLPVSLTPFIGREQELAAASALLRERGTRLLTLTGPGGVGKTRLAIQLASAEQEHLADQVIFLSFASIADPDLVGPMIARSLDPRDETGAQASNRRVLLVLDNLEHLLSAAPVVADALADMPGLIVLATSRAPLRLSGEQEFAVPPLAMPDHRNLPALADLVRIESVALFLQRARSVRFGFELTNSNASSIAELCQRLDGLPLAIELAAARCKVLAPDALLSRLEHRFTVLADGPVDAPTRQRTMRAAVDWSYGLLPESEQTVFRRLAVFTGGFSTDAAAAVCSLDDSSFDPLEIAASLVDKSFLLPSGKSDTIESPRFTMLETIRQFGLDELARHGESADFRERHAAYFLAFAERFADEDVMPVGAERFALFARDHDNLRAALAWFEQNGDVGRGLRLTASLSRFWYVRSHRAEGFAAIQRLLVNSTEIEPEIEAKALHGLGILTNGHLADERAVPPLRKSLALWRTFENDLGTAETLLMLGVKLENLGHYEEATDMHTEAEARFDRLGMHGWSALAHHHRGVQAYAMGDPIAAHALISEALARMQALAASGTPSTWMPSTLNDLGVVTRERGDLHGAARLHLDSMALWRASGTLEGVADALANLATVFAPLDPERAVRLFGAATNLATSLGYDFELPERDAHQRALAATRSKLTESAFTLAWEAGLRLSLDEAAAEASAEFPPEMPSTSSAPRPVQHLLSPREMDVLVLLAEGHTNRQIAEVLFISPRTAQVHVASILAKLDAPSRTAAVAAALRTGLLTSG